MNAAILVTTGPLVGAGVVVEDDIIVGGCTVGGTAGGVNVVAVEEGGTVAVETAVIGLYVDLA